MVTVMSEIEWFEIRDFFSEHGCVWMDQPEMRWYEESWGALRRAGLADEDTDDHGEVLVKLRAICLLKMYLVFVRALMRILSHISHTCSRVSK